MTIAHDSEEICCICLELVSNETGGESRCSGCAGVFCKPCIASWVSAAAVPACPLCRQCIVVETSNSNSPFYQIVVLVDWLLAKRSGYVSARTMSLGDEVAAVLVEAVLSIDNLLENCSMLFELPDNAPEVLAFHGHLLEIETSFTSLFAAVDMALCHDRVTPLFEERTPRSLSS